MTVDELMCKIACQDVMANFAGALDSGDNDLAADQFADDALLVRPDGEFRGPAVREVLRKRPPTNITRHTLSNIVVTPTGADTAKATCYVAVYRVQGSPSDALPRKMPATPAAAGDWNLELRKTGAGWRISRYDAVGKLEA